MINWSFWQLTCLLKQVFIRIYNDRQEHQTHSLILFSSLLWLQNTPSRMASTTPLMMSCHNKILAAMYPFFIRFLIRFRYGKWGVQNQAEIFVLSLKPFLNHFWRVAGCIFLLKIGPFNQGILLPGLSRGLCLKLTPTSMLLSKTLLWASHHLHRLALFSQCILLPHLPR